MKEQRRAGERAKPADLLADLDLLRDADLERRLDAYLDLIRQWRGSLDLLGRVTETTLREVHIREALLAVPSVPCSGRLLDIGSGVGVPAIPVLLARPGLHGVLLEPRERRWAFLREVVRALGLDAEVVREEVRRHTCDGYDVVTVRGVDPQLWWWELTRLMAPRGVLAWWTGEAKAGEWKDRADCGHVVLSALPSPGRGRLMVWRRCST